MTLCRTSIHHHVKSMECKKTSLGLLTRRKHLRMTCQNSTGAQPVPLLSRLRQQSGSCHTWGGWSKPNQVVLDDLRLTHSVYEVKSFWASHFKICCHCWLLEWQKECKHVSTLPRAFFPPRSFDHTILVAYHSTSHWRYIQDSNILGLNINTGQDTHRGPWILSERP